MVTTSKHPWQLVAPWYRWRHAALPADGRGTQPVFQKFASPQFVRDFLQQPQHSLVFDSTLDVVSGFDQIAAKLTGGLAGKIATLFRVDAKGDALPVGTKSDVYRSRLAPTNLRKLFLPSHDRHYLVATELHCDVAGFPTVPRREVCQAAFVVRRRRSIVPKGKEADVVAEAAKVTKAEADLAELLDLTLATQGRTPSQAEQAALDARKQELATTAGFTTFEALLGKRRSELEQLRAALQTFYDQAGVRVAIDGWFPHVVSGAPSKTSGAWRNLTAEEQERDPCAPRAGAVGPDGEATETLFRLYPLVPDPRDTAHDAAGRTIYYGVVPTTTSMHDDQGAPAFDAHTTLELRCFVRRHHECPPRRGKAPDCHGEVIWAKPTEPYRVAAPFDVLGSAQRPVTIQMPDLRELAAQVARRPRGSLSPVRVVQPQHMSPIPTDSTPGGDMGGPAICFFSIPLITIIAMFVLNLFLPIVVLVFQLWFLLVLRFCIKPQISIGGGVDAALAVQPPSIDLDVSVGIKLGGVQFTPGSLHSALLGVLGPQIKQEMGQLDTSKVDSGLGELSNNALGALAQSSEDNAKLPTDPREPLPDLSYAAKLVFEPHREPEWRVAGGRG